MRGRKTVGGKYKRWSERVWERRGGGGGVTMSHHQDLSSGGPGCCGGGSQCDTYAVTHTEGYRPSCCLYVSSCCGGGWKTMQGCHWDAQFTHTCAQAAALSSDTHTCRR